MNESTARYAVACWLRYLRHCDIYKVTPDSFRVWLVTA